MPSGVYTRTPKTREAIRRVRLGTSIPKEQRQKISESMNQIKINKDWLRRVSEGTKKAMRSPEIREKHLAGLARALKKGINFKGGNGQEPVLFVKKLEIFLSPAGFVREYAIGGLGRPGNYKVDFAHIEGKIALECDGPAHRPLKRRELDRKKDQILKSIGWRVIRVYHD